MSNIDNFTDIHCHIMPRLDDDAEKVEETEKKLRTAYKEECDNPISLYYGNVIFCRTGIADLLEKRTEYNT